MKVGERLTAEVQGVSSLTRRSALVCALITLVLAAVVAGNARAATLGISLAGCGTANNGFQFTINGSGFAGYAGLDVEVTSSEAGSGAEPELRHLADRTAEPVRRFGRRR